MITEEQIWYYLDGALTDAERKNVEATIASDQQANALFREISALHQSLKSQPALQVSAGFTDSVMASLNMAPARTAPTISLKLIFLFLLPTLLVILACAVLVVHYQIPLSYAVPFHVQPPVFKNMQFYFVIADILVLAWFMETFSEYRFNRKALFS